MRSISAVSVSEPDVPVTVTVAAPVVAVLMAVKVNVLDPVVLVGLNAAVTPTGRPDADKLTVPVNPFAGSTVMVAALLALCATFSVLGADRVKLPGGVTVNATVVVSTMVPEVPVTVTFWAPTVAVPLAVKVNVLVPVVLVGLNDAVTPLGRPDAARLTLPVNPPVGFTVIVLVPLPPWATLTVEGEAESV